MSKGVIKKSTAQAICDAVKAKEGTTEGVPFKDVANRILAIPKQKPEQEKTVIVTENGTTEITADEGYTLSKVTANVNVSASGENRLNQYCNKTLTEVTAEDLAGVTVLEAWFSSRESIKTVTIPNGVTTIKQSAFSACTGLTRVTMPDSVTEMEALVFQSCLSLTSINISKNLTGIKDYAFNGCRSLTSITIPNSVTSFGGYALGIGIENNPATVTFLGTTPPTINSASFKNYDSRTSYIEKIIVPKGYGDIYKSATNWADFADIIEEDTE